MGKELFFVMENIGDNMTLFRTNFERVFSVVIDSISWKHTADRKYIFVHVVLKGASYYDTSIKSDNNKLFVGQYHIYDFSSLKNTVNIFNNFGVSMTNGSLLNSSLLFDHIYELFCRNGMDLDVLGKTCIEGAGILYDCDNETLDVGILSSGNIKLYCAISLDGKKIYCNDFAYLCRVCDNLFAYEYTIVELTSGSCICNNKGDGAMNKIDKPVSRNLPHLSGYDKGIYLTDIEYDKDPSLGRDYEIRQLQKDLLIPKTGVLLVGAPGVGKSAIVDGLAYRIKNGDVCEFFQNKSILSVSSAELIAGTRYRGDFEANIEKLCKSLSKNKDIILFLDEMHTVLEDSTGISFADMLKPYISNDMIKVIGCTTVDEYNRFYLDPAFSRRYNILEVLEPKDNVLRSILKTYIYGNNFGINIDMSDDEINRLLDVVIKLSKRKQKYVNNQRCNPDASIKILMSALAYMVVENISNAKLNDFILGIRDNSDLHLCQIDEYLLSQSFVSDNYSDEFTENRSKILFKCNFK